MLREEGAAKVRPVLAGIDAACFDAAPMQIEPLRLPFDLTLSLPGSKSEVQRLVVAACLAKGRTTIRDATPCDDTRTLVAGLAAMGFSVAWFDEGDGILVVEGGLPATPPLGATLHCGMGGAPLRFLLAIAALVPGTWTLTGAPRLLARPHAPLVDALRMLGADIEHVPGSALVVRGGTLRGGEVVLDASGSSQFLSALASIAPRLDGGLRITISSTLASPSYAELTREVLSHFGVGVAVAGRRWTIPHGEPTSPGDLRAEGDWSAAGAFFVLARLTRGRFRGANLRIDSAQGDRRLAVLLDDLRAPGAIAIDVAGVPDQAPNLVVAALMRSGETCIRGGAVLRGKESDRIGVLCEELARTGADLAPTADGFVVRGGRALHGACLSCHDDHRLAMAFALLGQLVPGIEIDDPGCVSKSYPRFFADLRRARHSPRCIALVGMRGAGKSTLAPLLAAELGLECVDSDALFECERGSIRRFVAREGWPAFRAHEAAILAQCVGPGRVVAVGGGALETPGARALLKDRAIVVWLQEDEATLIARLAQADRPALGTLPLADEVHEALARRTPLYEDVADLVIPKNGGVDERCAAVAAWLREPWRAHAACSA